MHSVVKLSRSDLDKREKIVLPAKAGVMAFYSAYKALYYLKSNDLSKLQPILFADEDPNNPQRLILKPVLAEFEFIECHPAENDLEALVVEKRLLMQEIPQYQNKIRLSDQYSYLALNLDDPPYFSLKEDTIDRLLYIGPFSDRFFLIGALNALNYAVAAPVCPGSDYPCSLLDEQRCPAYCLQEDKSELKKIMEENLIVINKQLLAKISQQLKHLEDSLEFEKEIELQKAHKAIEQYYEYLLFFHTIKQFQGNFEFAGVEYSIKYGLLESITENNKTETFTAINNHFDDYEERERLALPKETFREMWVIFKYFSAHQSEKVDDLYKKSLLSIKKKTELEV